MRPHRILSIPVLASLLGVGCISDVGSGAAMFIVGQIAPNTECVFVTNTAFQLRGTLDVGPAAQFATPYDAVLEVHTSLPATFRSQDQNERLQIQPNYPGNYGQGNANVIILEEASIAFTDANGDPLPDSDIGGQPFQFPSPGNERISRVGATVFNLNNSVDAAVGLPLSIISLQEAQALNALVPPEGLELFATISLAGRTSGGGTITSPEFTVPVFLCKQCLLGVGAQFDGQNFICPNGNPPTPNAVCDPGQDVVGSSC